MSLFFSFFIYMSFSIFSLFFFHISYSLSISLFSFYLKFPPFPHSSYSLSSSFLYKKEKNEKKNWISHVSLTVLLLLQLFSINSSSSSVFHCLIISSFIPLFSLHLFPYFPLFWFFCLWSSVASSFPHLFPSFLLFS